MLTGRRQGADGGLRGRHGRHLAPRPNAVDFLLGIEPETALNADE